MGSVAGVMALAVLAGCGAPAEGPAAGAGGGAVSRPRVWHPGKPDTLGPVVAIVGGHRITRHDVDSVLATAPPQLQAQYRSSPDQYRLLVERLVANEAVYQAALRDSIQRQPDFRDQLARATRDLTTRYYYEAQLRRAPEPSDSAISAYYNDHLKDYYLPGRVRVRHILLRTRAQANSVRRRLSDGETWESLCPKASVDTLTAKNGGIMGYVTTDSDIAPGLGKAPEFVAAALALKEGEVSRPLHTSRGWHLIMADERREPTHTPLAEVQDRIKSQLKSRNVEQYSKAMVDSLEQYAGSNIFDDSIQVAIMPPKTPQQLFEQAQAAVNPRQRIDLYHQLITRFPKERVAEQASFMVGFTYAEELGDSAAARAAFDDFIQRHPKSDLVPSARWMIENMNKPNPPFDGEAPSDSTESPQGK
jgi:peptidyl-prolyl cis-trans isomerase C